MTSHEHRLPRRHNNRWPTMVILVVDSLLPFVISDKLLVSLMLCIVQTMLMNIHLHINMGFSMYTFYKKNDQK